MPAPSQSVQSICFVWSTTTNSSQTRDKQGEPTAMYTRCLTSSNHSRLAVMKGSSLAAAWALSQSSKDVYWRLYKAVWAGTKGDDCMVNYPAKGNTCQIFQWQKQSFMNTQYDHVEL